MQAQSPIPKWCQMATGARAWIFQYNQTRYEIVDFMQEHGEVDYCRVTARPTDVSVADRIYFRRSARSGKWNLLSVFSAVCRVVSAVYQRNPPDYRTQVV